MCGIAGYAGFPGIGESVLLGMVDKITHRGPDDFGITESQGTGIGMRRLSIIDVAHGHQPIQSEDGRYSITFNGEIYNYRDIKREIERHGKKFYTNSDTEVLLVSYELWGAECLDRLRGMFTFAILDRKDGSLFIARDRLGVKPLYISESDGKIVFGSEIKSILEHPAISPSLNPNAVDDYLALRYVPGPETLFSGIRKFPAAHYMTWKNGQAKMMRYWTADSGPEWTGNRQEAQEVFDDLFDESTRIRMISERPVGAFLSGGLDSTAIVTSLSKQFSDTLQTFSVGFGWQGDELSAAARTAQRLGCDHHEIVCGLEDTALLPKIIWHLDEPVGDGIILPMYLLSRFAAEKVTVVQSGEGADEILGGYFMHRVMKMATVYSRYMPEVLQKRLVLPVARNIPAGALNRLFDYPGELGEQGKQRLIQFLEVLGQKSTALQYQFIISLFQQTERQSMYTSGFSSSLRDTQSLDDEALDFNGMLGLQFEHWLPDDILCKQDKITMANSLEGRVPLMDHKLVEFAMSLPANYKIGARRNKLPLRTYLSKNGANETARHKKVPFYIPIDRYLSEGPLHEMMGELLSEPAVKRRGMFKWEAIRQMRGASGDQGFLYGKQLFSVLMLELWCRIFIDGEQGWV